MSRKDTIIITVLINLGILAVLFATAIIYDDDTILDNPVEVQKSLAASSTKTSSSSASVVEVMKPMEMTLVTAEMPTDEVDHVLNEYVNSDGREESIFEDLVQESTPPKNHDAVSAASPGDVVEVTIKRGDALEKIARANNTTVSAIMKENNLRSEKLSVGQVLRVPVGTKKNVASTVSIQKNVPESTDKQYYIVKSGDSPWKIAKQFNVKFEDLLTLNNLNEEKARNLKVGDKIRVK